MPYYDFDPFDDAERDRDAYQRWVDDLAPAEYRQWWIEQQQEVTTMEYGWRSKDNEVAYPISKKAITKENIRANAEHPLKWTPVYRTILEPDWSFVEIDSDGEPLFPTPQTKTTENSPSPAEQDRHGTDPGTPTPKPRLERPEGDRMMDFFFAGKADW